MFTWRKTFTVIPAASAFLCSSCASDNRSKECIYSNLPITSLTLLVCKCPIKCHVPLSPSAFHLCSASCQRLSAMSSRPASNTAATVFSDTYFVTAITLTSLTSRPLAAQARATRPSTSAILSCSVKTNVQLSFIPIQLVILPVIPCSFR
ncbi:hypothetical protein D3C74_331780 [compost metagenome]